MDLKKYRNQKGQVGVIHSPCYGAPWIRFDNYYAPHLHSLLVSDYKLVEAVLDEDDHAFQYRLLQICLEYDICVSPQPVADLSVYFMAEGTVYETDVHDGYERIVELGRGFIA